MHAFFNKNEDDDGYNFLMQKNGRSVYIDFCEGVILVLTSGDNLEPLVYEVEELSYHLKKIHQFLSCEIDVIK